MKGEKKICTVCVRCTTEVLRKWSELSTMQQVSKAECLAMLVAAAYDQYQGNPELLRLMEQLKVVRSQIDAINGK